MIQLYLRLVIGLGLIFASWLVAQAQKPGEGRLELTITDGEGGKPVPCRVHIKNQAGVARRAFGMPFWHDHFVTPGQVELVYPTGNYTLLVERGPEYADHSGYFILQNFSKDAKTIAMKRAVDMADEGWWSGDLHVHRSVKEIEQFMRADDLHVAPLVTWTNKTAKSADVKIPERPVTQFDGNRYFDNSAGEDRRASGTLLYFRSPRAFTLPASSATEPTTTEILNKVRENADVWVDAADPYSWDLPVWLAAEGVNSIGVLHEQFGREQLSKKPILGRGPDVKGTKTDADWGEWSQRIYWHVLNCGLRIPPSAGSGTGEGPNALGYNRMYVWVDKDAFDYAAWWEAFARGRVTVTNGPLIRPLANGRLPGHVFTLAKGEQLPIDIAMNMAIREQVRYMEVIRNGQLAQSIRLEDWAKTGHFQPLKVDGSGWFLVRVVTEAKGTYRFACTAPWYVEAAGEPKRISRKSVQFFLTWLEERALKFGAAPDAEAWWRALLERANAD
jgi:hypothetical protein